MLQLPLNANAESKLEVTIMATAFDRDEMARWYASQHLQTDPGITAVYYLPANTRPREIRFIEVNELMGNRKDSSLEPIDFGVDFGTQNEHKLFVLDVTPDQWERIRMGTLSLPGNWSLENLVAYQ